MFGNYYGAHIASGKSNGRSVWQDIENGRLTISGNCGKDKFVRRVTYKDCQITDNKFILNNKTVHHIVYGEYETTPKGITRFRKGSGTGRHGKSRLDCSLFKEKGVCHSWYVRGRLMRQKFIYENRKTAYDYRPNKPCSIRSSDGKVLLFQFTGVLKNSYDNVAKGCCPVFEDNIEMWFLESKPFEVIKNGKAFYKGQHNNKQKVGEWVIDGKEFYYEHGVAIPKDLYFTPPEKLNPLEILKIGNAQLRMALMSKIDPERIAKAGKIIHKEGDMRLYSIKNFDVRILRVRCTTTKSYYFLKVPKDATKCEEARQWTFGVGEYLNKPIKFEVET